MVCNSSLLYAIWQFFLSYNKNFIKLLDYDLDRFFDRGTCFVICIACGLCRHSYFVCTLLRTLLDCDLSIFEFQCFLCLGICKFSGISDFTLVL